jgi:tetratricopeptide (TPR) repeat protein
MKEVVDKAEKTALQRLIERYNLQEFNIEVLNGHVTTIAIKFKNLYNVPPEIQSFLELETLDLSRNHIATIENITPLINLRILRLRDNKITKLRNLETLTRLNELDLADNQIEEMDGLFNLRNLILLDLSRNQISEIKGIENCAILQTLKLNENPIQKISGLDKLNNIEVLLLAKTHIGKIEGIEHLSYLRELNLAMNQIKKIEGINGLISLKKLNLADNQIRTIQDIERLKSLQEIMLNNNPLSPEDLPYVGRPAREIVLYSFQKLDRHRKNQEFKESIKKARTEYQVKVEISSETVIQTPENIKSLRNQLIEESQQSDEQNAESIQTANKFVPEKQKSDIEEIKIKEPQLAIRPSFLDNAPKPKPQIDESQNKFRFQTEPQIKPPSAPSFVPSLKEKQEVFMPISENQVKHNLHFGPRAAYKPDLEKIERIAEEDAKRAAMVEKAAKQKNPTKQNNEATASNQGYARDGPIPVPNPEILPVLGENYTTETEWFNFANRLLESEDYKNALIAYRNTLQLNTRNLQAWIYSGIAFNNRSDYRRSVRAFKQAIAINEKDPMLWTYLGIGFYNMMEMEDAARALNEALILDPMFMMAKEYLAMIPSEFKQHLNLIEQQAELLAQSAQTVEDKLLLQIEQLKQSHEAISYEELLPYIYNPPTITDIPSLKHKITDLIMQNRLAAKLQIDHIEFNVEIAANKQREKVAIEDYFILKKLLAFTNFSKLWVAEDKRTAGKCVLKHIIFRGDFMRVKLAEQIALREIALLSKINSPHVIPIWDSFIGEYQGETGYFIQEPYYEFGTLDKRIRDLQEQYPKTQQLMDPKAVLSIFIGLLKGLVGIHEAGIIHRDIKPANIIINTDAPIPSENDIILIDFGIAIAPEELAEKNFALTQGCGTKGFSPPEQFEGPEVDFTADLYAAAATIYYTMTLIKYEGVFYIPDYAMEFYHKHGLGIVFSIIERMLDENPANRSGGLDELKIIIGNLDLQLLSME